jgi:hypothetical protein
MNAAEWPFAAQAKLFAAALMMDGSDKFGKSMR